MLAAHMNIPKGKEKSQCRERSTPMELAASVCTLAKCSAQGLRVWKPARAAVSGLRAHACLLLVRELRHEKRDTVWPALGKWTSKRKSSLGGTPGNAAEDNPCHPRGRPRQSPGSWLCCGYLENEPMEASSFSSSIPLPVTVPFK